MMYIPSSPVTFHSYYQRRQYANTSIVVCVQYFERNSEQGPISLKIYPSQWKSEISLPQHDRHKLLHIMRQLCYHGFKISKAYQHTSVSHQIFYISQLNIINITNCVAVYKWVTITSMILSRTLNPHRHWCLYPLLLINPHILASYTWLPECDQQTVVPQKVSHLQAYLKGSF